MARTIDQAALEAWDSALLQGAGLAPDAADTVAKLLVEANLCGVDSHGTSRLST